MGDLLTEAVLQQSLFNCQPSQQEEEQDGWLALGGSQGKTASHLLWSSEDWQHAYQQLVSASCMHSSEAGHCCTAT